MSLQHYRRVFFLEIKPITSPYVRVGALIRPNDRFGGTFYENWGHESTAIAPSANRCLRLEDTVQGEYDPPRRHCGIGSTHPVGKSDCARSGGQTLLSARIRPSDEESSLRRGFSGQATVDCKSSLPAWIGNAFLALDGHPALDPTRPDLEWLSGDGCSEDLGFPTGGRLPTDWRCGADRGVCAPPAARPPCRHRSPLRKILCRPQLPRPAEFEPPLQPGAIHPHSSSAPED